MAKKRTSRAKAPPTAPGGLPTPRPSFSSKLQTKIFTNTQASKEDPEFVRVSGGFWLKLDGVVYCCQATGHKEFPW